MVHALQDLTRAGFSVPGSQGCRAYNASASAGLVLVAHRASLAVHAWVDAPAAAPPSLQCLRRISLFTLGRPSDAAAELCITSVQPCGAGLVCASLVHRSALGVEGLVDYVLGDGGEACEGSSGSSSSSGISRGGGGSGSSEACIDLPSLFLPFGGRGEGVGGGAGASPSTPASSDTGYSLSYLVLHAYTGALVRIVRAGAAPPLDAAGALASPPATASPESLDAPLRAMHSLLQSLDLPTAPTPSTRLTWGTATGSKCWRGGSEPTLILSAVLPTAGVRSDSMASLAFEVDLGAPAAASGSSVAPTAALCKYCSGRVPEDGCVCHGGAEALVGGRSRGPMALSQGLPLVLLERHHPFRLLASPSQPLLFAAHASGLLVFSACNGALLQEVRGAGVVSMELVAAPLPAAPAGDAAAAAAGAESSTPAPHSAPQQHHVLVTLRTGILLLRAFPLIMQIAALQSARPPHYQTALALCNLSQDSLQGGGVPAQRARAIRAEHGYNLFRDGEFEAALMELEAAGVPSSRVVALFPRLLPSARAGEGGPALTPPSALPLPPSYELSATSQGSEAPSEATPELGGSSAPLLPAALAALAVYLARCTARSAKGRLDMLLLETLLWLRNHHRARAQGALSAAVQRAVHWCLRRRGSVLPLEEARELLVGYGVALGAGGALALELVTLYSCQGLFAEALEVLALELEGRGDAEEAAAEAGGGEEAEEEEGSLTLGADSSAATSAILSELLEQLKCSVGALTARGEGAAAEGLLHRVLAPLLVGGGGMEGTLLALRFCASASMPQAAALRVMDALQPLSREHPFPPSCSPLWYAQGRTGISFSTLSDSSAEEEEEEEHSGYAEADAAMLQLTPRAWLRHARIAFLEHACFPAALQGAPPPPALPCALLSHYAEALEEIAQGLSAGALAPRARDEAAGLLREYRLRTLALLQAPALQLDAEACSSALASALFAGEEGLVEERAFFLGRLQRHHEALRILLVQLGDWPSARAYCAQAGGEAYATLTAVALEAGGGALPSEAVAILVENAPRLRASQVLAGMPEATPLAQLGQLLEAALGQATLHVRLAAAERSTGEVASVRARLDMVRVREKRYRVIDRADVCGVCGRRLGVAAGGGVGGGGRGSSGGSAGEMLRPPPLAILRNGAKVHLACLAGVREGGKEGK